jgi:phosphatidylinositol kinase/protein kinase (PI-3  family)
VTGPEGGFHIASLFDYTQSILGLFRIACEITLQILRTNKDCLMSVLDAFIHDPLMEWEDEKRRLVQIFHNRTGIVVTDQMCRIESRNTGITT